MSVFSRVLVVLSECRGDYDPASVLVARAIGVAQRCEATLQFLQVAHDAALLSSPLTQVSLSVEADRRRDHLADEARKLDRLASTLHARYGVTGADACCVGHPHAPTRSSSAHTISVRTSS